MKHWHPATKIVLVFGLLAAVWLVVSDEQGEQPVMRAIAAPATTASSPFSADRIELPQRPAVLAALPPLEAFTATVERPLFTPGRRPPEAAEDSAPAPRLHEALAIEPAGPPEPALVFVGTMMRDGETVAMIMRDGSSDMESLRLGDDIDGWSVSAIDQRSLQLRHEDEIRNLAILD